MSGKKAAVFFDRDGVVNVAPGPGYVLCWAEFHFSPGIIEALRLCKAHGLLTIIVTSQQGVGKGLMSQADLDHIHAEMQKQLAEHGAAFDGIYACTHLAGTCTCRKPGPEMITRAAADHDIDPGGSLLIGDHDRDIQMARAAGVPATIRIRGDKPITTPADQTLDSTSQLIPALEAWWRSRGGLMP